MYKRQVEVIPITLNTNIKNWYVRGSQTVINRVAELTGKHPLVHLTNSVSHSLENYTAGQEELSHIAHQKYNVQIMYTGLTYNPPMADMQEYIQANYQSWGGDLSHITEAFDSRDTERDQESYNSECEPTERAPFRDKIDVYRAYKAYNMLDKLYPYTFSCENDYHLDLNNLVHCNNCFFCLERWYAFGRII